MRTPQIIKPDFSPPTLLPDYSSLERAMLPDVAFGKHGPPFPAAIVFVLLLLMGTDFWKHAFLEKEESHVTTASRLER